MPSRLRQLQIEWNELVPMGQQRGLNVRPVALYPAGLHERIPHRQRRINWLRSELNLTTILNQSATIEQLRGVDLGAGFDSPFTFGVELEIIMPSGWTSERLALELTNAGIRTVAETYNHQVRQCWKIVTDASLGDYVRGREVVSPVLSGDEGIRQLYAVCQVLTRINCKVNKNCGLHVHIGARNESIGFFRNIVAMYADAEPIIDTFMAPSRRASNNHFCRALRLDRRQLALSTNLNEVAAALSQSGSAAGARSSSRYCKLNLQSFWQHGTVEFRQHQGTVDAEKAVHWVRFCLRLALAARKETVSLGNTLESLLTTLGATESEVHYFIGRATHFNRLQNRSA